jgi:hypothetical protein
MVITLCAECEGKILRIGWVSLQPDGSVSVGLNDRALIVRHFEEKQFLWNVFNRITVEYFVPDDPLASRSVAQPHLTFHPPHWFHLTGGPKRKLFEGIADIELAVRQQGTVPWVRFISKPLEERRPRACVRSARIGGSSSLHLLLIDRFVLRWTSSRRATSPSIPELRIPNGRTTGHTVYAFR